MHIKITLALLFLPLLFLGQTYKPGKKGGLYSTGQELIDKGWFFGLGGTYMFPYLKESDRFDFTDTLNQIFTQDYEAKPTGKFGLFLELGTFKMTDKRFINYRDIALSYKWFRGGEDFTSQTFFNNTLFSQQETDGSYSSHAASLNYNLGYRFDATDKRFFVNGLGINADYFFITSRNNGGIILGEPHEFVSDFVAELHYFFGIGFKTGKRLIIMPMVETPIFAFYEFNHIESTHDYFNTRSRPIIFKVRFMFLKKGSKSCPAVFNPMGIDPKNQAE